MQSGELALVSACSLASSQIVLNQSGEKLLRLDKANLNVTMGVTLQEQLLLNVLGQDGEDSEGSLGQAVLDELILGSPSRQSIESVSLCACQQLVDLSDQDGELRNELDRKSVV